MKVGILFSQFGSALPLDSRWHTYPDAIARRCGLLARPTKPPPPRAAAARGYLKLSRTRLLVARMTTRASRLRLVLLFLDYFSCASPLDSRKMFRLSELVVKAPLGK